MRRGPAAVALWAVVVWAAAFAGAAMAQPAAQIEPSAASQCLQATDPALPEPEYPFLEYKSGDKGRVKVALRFARPDRAPAVEVLESEGSPEFVQSVRGYTRTLRVPCLPAGETAVLTQEYLFRTNWDRGHARPAEDAGHERRRELLSCRQHASGDVSPNYPTDARRSGTAGKVLARLRFSAPDRPPELLQLAHHRDARPLAATVRTWVRGYRLPCMVAGQDDPLEIVLTFDFRFEGSAAGFTALTLPQLMRVVKDLDQQTLQIDTTTMGCPFELQLQYRQPHLPNSVRLIGEASAMQAPLLNWLRDITLDLPDRGMAIVYGDTADIAVPCLKIDLKPKE